MGEGIEGAVIVSRRMHPMSGEAASGEAVSGEAVLGETVFGENVSGDATSASFPLLLTLGVDLGVGLIAEEAGSCSGDSCSI